jgi:hypothetical protein
VGAGKRAKLGAKNRETKLVSELVVEWLLFHK